MPALSEYNKWVRQEAIKRSAGLACAGCAKPLPYEKRRHKHCSRSCAALHIHRLNGRERNCESCGTRLKSRQRITCSYKCSNDRKYSRYIERWKRGEVAGGSWRSVSGHVKRWLIETYGERCQRCNWRDRHPVTKRVPLQADHKDGNPENHSPNNLQLLCPNCHSLTPNFGGLNRGHGRKRRYASVV